MNILIVDDEIELGSGLKEILELEGHDVDFISEASVALNKALSEDYCVIILDVKMPEFGGEEFYTRLISKKPEAKVLFVSGHPGLENERFQELGGIGLLAKPIDTQKLIDFISLL